MLRCINLDWLEVFAEEPEDRDLDLNYFLSRGYQVVNRGYGTRMYAEMFTVYYDGLPYIEVRRKPLSVKEEGGIFNRKACHLRLSNRVCYMDRPIDAMRVFMVDNGYTFRGISRIDICMDFHKFDSGDDPRDFIQRYIERRYSKINQSIAKARWEDSWDDRFITWISWGLPSSMVSTKIYLKSRELQNVGDKPWIRQAWQESELIDNMDHVDKDIWRVEFSVKGGSAKWVSEKGPDGGNILPNTLEQYESRYKLIYIFRALAEHYFHFKKVERKSDGTLKRKDRCSDKVLFRWSGKDIPYRLTRLTKAIPETRQMIYLVKNLRAYADKINDNSIKSSFIDAADWIYCQVNGIDRELRKKSLEDIFERTFFDDISGQVDMPFIGDDLESFVYQYNFNKNFMSN